MLLTDCTDRPADWGISGTKVSFRVMLLPARLAERAMGELPHLATASGCTSRIQTEDMLSIMVTPCVSMR